MGIELPAEVRERAARAALESFHKPRHPMYTFETTTEGYRGAWREVVDAVAEVLAEHQRPFRFARIAALVEKEGFPAEAVYDAVADLVDERDNLRVDRDKFKEAWRTECGRLLNTLDAADRKLVKQRKRRKAAEACYQSVREQLHNRTVALEQIEAERDALLARVENLRAALDYLRVEYTDTAKVASAALAADDRAAGQAEEAPDDHA